MHISTNDLHSPRLEPSPLLVVSFLVTLLRNWSLIRQGKRWLLLFNEIVIERGWKEKSGSVY
jgi:hypothetical protein